jgi:membrane-associated protease RseP (regulator of RpoE activity)
MLDQLHDPYSVFLKRDDFKALNEATTGNYGGLGIQIEVRDGWITVVAPLPDTPAERAGIQTSDQIVALDGRSTEGWKQDQAVKELRGEAGSAVELKVHRVGIEQPLTFKLTRALIHVRIEQEPVVHAIEMVACQDQVVVGFVVREMSGGLSHGVSGPLKPVRVIRRLLRGDNIHEPAGERIHVIALRDVPVQRRRIVLRQDEDLGYLRINAVGNRYIDQPVFTAQRDGGL